MPSRRNKFNTSWATGSSKNEPLNERCSVGRKLLEKMGWENGLGLGKDNQGMIENPLWKYHRGDSKQGFKCKEEMAKETLPHQNAFEDLLGELNSQTGEESINTDDSIQRKVRERVKSSQKRLRYKKMARAKDISNYSAKDFEGIVGKKVTEKNLDLLCESANSNTPSNLEVSNEVFCSQICESSSEQFVVDNNSFNLEKSNKQLFVSQKHETFVESSTYVSDGSKELAEMKNRKKKNKRHSKSSIRVESNALEYCSTQAVASTSGECIDSQSKESEVSEDIDIFNTELSVKKKSRKKIKRNSENYAVFTTLHCTLQSTETNKKKKKKKMKENMEDCNTCYTNYSTSPGDTNLDEKPTYPAEYMCNTKSSSESHKKDSTEDEGVSRNAVTQFDTSVGTSNKSNLERTETIKEGNEVKNDCTALDDADKNGDNNSIKFLLRTNNFFLTGEERKKIKKHLAENPEILPQVASAFVGSNLISIKGYGNW